MKRRTFIKVVGSAASAYALSENTMLTAADTPAEEKVAGLPRRPLGRTGKKVSVVGFPGLALVHYDQERCTKALHDAFARGVNYFDVAPAYGNLVAETRMGIGMQGIDRSRIVLACKTKKRDKDDAREELERSLKLLKTDYFDLYQMHHIVTPAEAKQALGPGGAVETFLKARDEGKVKHFGFSAHTTKGALELMQTAAGLSNGFRFDTAMFPINFVEYFNHDYGRAVLELANEQGLGVLAIKPLSRGQWAKDAKKTHEWWYQPVFEEKEVSMALRFALSQKRVASGIPPSFLDVLDKAIEAGKTLQSISEQELQQLRQIAVNCTSIFRREEGMVALGQPSDPSALAYYEHPIGGCCAHAHTPAYS
jgi:predicted aldo/keto reductase-like oxidoreductase